MSNQKSARLEKVDERQVSIFWPKATPCGINSTWKKQGRNSVWEKSNQLLMYLWFFDIFPVLDEFFPYFPFICKLSRFLHNVIQNIENFLWQTIIRNTVKKIQKFPALLAICNTSWRFYLVLVRKSREGN